MIGSDSFYNFRAINIIKIKLNGDLDVRPDELVKTISGVTQGQKEINLQGPIIHPWAQQKDQNRWNTDQRGLRKLSS